MNQLASTTNEIISAARQFAREIIEPNAESWNADGSVPRIFFEQAAAAGLCRLLVPAERGGHGLGLEEFTAVLANLAAHCLTSTFALVVHNNLAAAIARNGTALQIERYLGAMMRGEKIGAFLLTEPGVGSDATAITTFAEKGEHGWILNGAKAWISNTTHADILSVYAQTAAKSGARGIASFLVDADHAGVTRGPGYALLGGHALGTGGFEFTDCVVDDGALMVPPGQAFQAAMRGINLARCSVAAMCCGILERALAEAVRYTGQRDAFGAHIGDFQGVQWMLADCATDLEAARALTSAAARRLDQGDDATLPAAHAKKFASVAAFKRIADCMQVMGAAGLSREYPLARHLEAAKIAQYLDGATEIQNVVIARRLGDVYAC